jgi:Uma2 family endonuclease
MSAQPARKCTPQEYLAIERQNDVKSEYWSGEMFAMAGASEAHNLIVLNVGAELRAQLKGKSCRVYPSDMRVRIPRKPSYKYPDVSVVCGQPRFEDDHRDILLNPLVIVEVLSPSSESYDRGAKFREYRAIDALQEYVLISQEQPLIERYMRQAQTRFWTLSDAAGLDERLVLESIACELALAEVYAQVEFPAPAEKGVLAS